MSSYDFYPSSAEPHEPAVPDQTFRGWPDPDECRFCSAETVDGVCVRCDAEGETP